MSTAPLGHLAWGHEGPPVLLLHGIGGGRRAWPTTGPMLAAAGLRVFALDLPGYGDSGAVEPFDLPGMADAVARFVDWVGTPAAVVGHSMGGMVAQELVARHPNAVRALVLASTSPAFGPADGDWQQGFIASRCAPLDRGLGMAGLAAELVPAMVAPGADPDRIAAAQALMAAVPEAVYRASLAALVRFDGRAALPRIGVPTLVITGEQDRSAPPDVSRRMAAKIPGAVCEILPGAGHLPMLEQPAAFDAVLLRFLQGVLS